MRTSHCSDAGTTSTSAPPAPGRPSGRPSARRSPTRAEPRRPRASASRRSTSSRSGCARTCAPSSPPSATGSASTTTTTSARPPRSSTARSPAGGRTGEARVPLRRPRGRTGARAPVLARDEPRPVGAAARHLRAVLPRPPLRAPWSRRLAGSARAVHEGGPRTRRGAPPRRPRPGARGVVRPLARRHGRHVARRARAGPPRLARPRVHVRARSCSERVFRARGDRPRPGPRAGRRRRRRPLAHLARAGGPPRTNARHARRDARRGLCRRMRGGRLLGLPRPACRDRRANARPDRRRGRGDAPRRRRAARGAHPGRPARRAGRRGAPRERRAPGRVRGRDPRPRTGGGMTDDEGMRVRREVLGDEHVDAALARTDDFTRDFQELITRYAWGEVWSRPGLDRRTRSAITLTALVALGHDHELAMHVRAALRNGLTPDEIKEVLLQTAVYCGVPAANRAFAIAQEVLAE